MSRHAILTIVKRDGPQSVKQLAAHLGINESSTRTAVRRARAHGTKYLRIAAWAGGVALYGPGPGEDAEGGPTGARVLADLDDRGPARVSKIAERLGLPADLVDSAVRRLKSKPGMLHIVGWERQVGQGGREAPIYAAGIGNNAPRPDFTGAAAEYERRRVAKRRVLKVVNGLPVRPKRRVQNVAVAGPFDGLFR